MINFDLKDTVDQHDTPQSLVTPAKIRSQDTVLFYDMSASVPGNNIPAIGSITSEALVSGIVNELRFRSPFGAVQLTDEYFYDEQTKQELPLWYRHTLKKRVFNDTLLGGRYFQSDVNGNFELQEITPGDRDIVFNTEQFTRIDGGGERTEHNDYYIDYGRRIITGIFNQSLSVEILFETVVPNLTISQNDTSRYKVLHEKTNNDEFIVHIFTESSTPLNVVYYTKNRVVGSIEVIETTNAVPVYSPIPIEFISDTRNREKKVFAVAPTGDNDFVIQTSQARKNENIYKEFSFRSAENVYTKIYPLRPFDKGFSEPWFARIKGVGYSFEDEAGIQSFDPPELKRIKPIQRITETAAYLDQNKIRIKQPPIWETNEDGDIVGIQVIEDSTGNELEVVNIQTQNRIIELRNRIGRENKIRVEYRTRRRDVVIPNDLNSIITPDGYNFYHLYFIVPLEDLMPDPREAIFVYRLPRFQDQQKLIFNSQDLLLLFEAQKPIILNSISHLLNKDIGAVRAYLLGVFYVENPVDEDFAQILDSRIRGGGFKEETEHCGEWSYWDGEAVDISGRLLFKIKRSVKNFLVERYLEFSDEAQLSENPRGTAEKLAEDRIHRAIQKHIRKGFHYELEYVE